MTPSPSLFSLTAINRADSLLAQKKSAEQTLKSLKLEINDLRTLIEKQKGREKLPDYKTALSPTRSFAAMPHKRRSRNETDLRHALETKLAQKFVELEAVQRESKETGELLAEAWGGRD